MSELSGSASGLQFVRPVSLLFVEDHRIFAEVLAARLRRLTSTTRIDIATSLSEARANLRRAWPDLILLDYYLDGEDGLGLFPDLSRMDTSPAVLVLSGSDDPEQVVRAFRAGALGWVSKTAPFEDLVLAANEVLRGHMYLPPGTLKPVLHELLAAHEDQPEPTFVDTLSARQLEVLECLVAGMSRAECAQRLHLSVHTIRTHVQQLLKRADVHSTLALASRARALGVRGIDE